jgi:hypothetical protein
LRTPTALVAALVCTVLTAVTHPQADTLAAEIARWSALLEADARADPLWVDAKKSGQPVLAQADAELRQGRRLVALERLMAAGQSLGAALYAIERPAEERTQLASFEAEWRRTGAALRDVVSPATSPDLVAGIRPAFVRALAELSASQARESYAASLEYGRNTEPQFGLYYLGAARAHRRFLDLARALPTPPVLRAPALRALAAEIDSLQGDLLAAYQPPAAIDRHGEFIVASAALKEARELDASGSRHAALLRYLQAAQRVAVLRPVPDLDGSAVRRRLSESAAHFKENVDHSVARFFVERAESALSSSSGSAGEPTAAAIAADVLPKYFAALDPPRPAAAAQPPRVTVTLVRWPFT